MPNFRFVRISLRLTHAQCHYKVIRLYDSVENILCDRLDVTPFARSKLKESNRFFCISNRLSLHSRCDLVMHDHNKENQGRTRFIFQQTHIQREISFINPFNFIFISNYYHLVVLYTADCSSSLLPFSKGRKRRETL